MSSLLVQSGTVHRFDQTGSTHMSTIQRFLREEEGATAIEYGLIAAGIAIVIIAAVNGVGQQLNTTFTSISGTLASDNGR
jgi:pilus assembly protein Flp/PilA